MTGSFAEMPLYDSPWVKRHDSADVENYIAYYRALASGIADLLGTQDSRTADSFLTGAQQALVRFNISTRAHKKTSRSTFRFAEQKDGKPVTVFLVADASRIPTRKNRSTCWPTRRPTSGSRGSPRCSPGGGATGCGCICSSSRSRLSAPHTAGKP